MRSKKVLLIFLSLFSLLMVVSFGFTQTTEYAPNRILVKFKDFGGTSIKNISPANILNYESLLSKESIEVLKKINGKIVYMSRITGVAIVSIPETKVKEAIENLYKANVVEYAEPDYIVRAVEIPNDTYFGSLWGLNDLDDTDIDAPEGWNINFNGTGVIVGVVDTGIDYTHVDLTNNTWINPKEICWNGKDDDGNGWIDDCHGIDTYNDDADPMDDNGHGTHVAGIIGAVGNNGEGVVGVAWDARIMALKFLNDEGWGYISDAIRAIEYYYDILEANGINKGVLNNSWGSTKSSKALYDTMRAGIDRGILFICAAGNERKNIDSSPLYPAAYDLPNIISVGASNTYDERAWFSNYGTKGVDLFAPGENILSTIPANHYEYYSGTSMATPYVTGAVAVVWTYYLDKTWESIKGLILNGVDQPLGLQNTSLTQGRLNLYNSLSISPDKPSVWEITPNIARRGQKISIKGFNFGNIQGEVKIDSIGLPIISWNDTQIVAQVRNTTPRGIYSLKVITTSGESIGVWFRVK